MEIFRPINMRMNVWLSIIASFFSIIFVNSLSTQPAIKEPEALKEAKKSYSQKKYDTAIKQFTSYAESNPGDGVPYLYMGYIYETRKDFPKSIAMFKKALDGKLTPEQRKTTLLKLALYFNYYQEWDQAYIYATRYLALNPDNREIQKIRDRAEANRGKSQPTSTPQIITQEKSKPKTELEYEEILRKNPKDEEARWELSLIYFNEKKFSQAEKLLQSLVNDFPNKPSYSYKLGVTKIRLEKFEEAVDLFQKAKPHIPESDKKFLYFLFLNEGLAYYKLERYYEAEMSLKKAYELNATNLAVIGLQKIYYNIGKNQECIQISEGWKDDLEIKMYRALCNYELKEAGPLFAFENELKSQFPTSIPEIFFPGLMKLAREYTNNEKYSQAEEYFKIIEKQYYNEREYLFYRGKALYYSGFPEKALPYLEKVDKSSAAFYLCAKAYAKLGNKAKSKEYILKATEMKPVYWDFAMEEDDFIELRKDPSFLQFLTTKGKE